MATMFWLQSLRAAHNSCHFVRAFLGVTFFTDSVGGDLQPPNSLDGLYLLSSVTKPSPSPSCRPSWLAGRVAIPTSGTPHSPVKDGLTSPIVCGARAEQTTLAAFQVTLSWTTQIPTLLPEHPLLATYTFHKSSR